MQMHLLVRWVVPKQGMVIAMISVLGRFSKSIARAVTQRAKVEMCIRDRDTMSFYFGGKCAVAYVTREMVRQSGANDEDMPKLITKEAKLMTSK